MADEKQIIIGTNPDDVIRVMWGTGIKGNPETEVSTTNTFSGAIVDGTDNIPYTLEVDKIRNDNIKDHIKLSKKLDTMLTTRDDITVIDTIKPKGQDPYEVIDHYFGCLVDSNDYEVATDDLTTESLSFKAESRKREWKNLKTGQTFD